ncbi:hypothetical protein [Endozoicomonas sp. Mp262]|uniref:hypothetical protein n=1 Tax=Endozoicomonas sp. Mp262 TaxID=2919499 RepID=UPI0021D8D894
MNITIQQLFPLIMEQQVQSEAIGENHYVIEINKELSAQVITGSQQLWLITELGSWLENNQSLETDQVAKVLRTMLANAAGYEESVSIDEEGKLLLQRCIKFTDLTEDELIDAFYRHGTFATYLYPLLERKESITWQHHGFIRP